MCKYWSCTPSQLQEESEEDIEIHLQVYNQIMEKNPLF